MTQHDLMNTEHADEQNTIDLSRLNGHRFCTEEQPLSHRLEWLKEVIGKEYANVEITPSRDTKLFNDMLIYPWQQGLRLSPIQSHALTLERLTSEPTEIAQDCYFAVVLISGQYKLEQGGREVFLQPGEMTLYDATEPHRLTMPESFSKILISIPRNVLDQRVHNAGKLTATKIPSSSGIGAITSSFIQSTVKQLGQLDEAQFLEMSDPVLDLFTLSLKQLSSQSVNLSRHQNLTLMRVKQFVSQHCEDSQLNPEAISAGVGLSIRYINNLFNEEQTSLMRYLTQQRLELAHRHLSSQLFGHQSVTEIAMQCGFNNMPHFSRIFKSSYGMSPRQYRELNQQSNRFRLD